MLAKAALLLPSERHWFGNTAEPRLPLAPILEQEPCPETVAKAWTSEVRVCVICLVRIFPIAGSVS